MPFAVRFYFSGLCHFSPRGGTPAKPHSLKVLLVNAIDKSLRPQGVDAEDVCVHLPRLVVARRHLVTLGNGVDPSEIRPAADGEDLALFDLRGQELVADSTAGPELEIARATGQVDGKPSAADERWFEWTLNLNELDSNLGGLHPDADRIGPRVGSSIEFMKGWLSTWQVGRRGGDMLQFKFLGYKSTKSAALSIRSITDRLVLEVSGLSSELRLRLGDDEIGIEANYGETAHVSVTNLCDRSDSYEMERLTDFLWFYNLVKEPPSAKDMIIPVVVADSSLTPSTGSCPPTRSG